MNLLEQALHYPLGQITPEVGKTLEIKANSGVYWLRMKLPFVLNHINLWLLRDEIDGRKGWTVVDCCIDYPESRSQWEQIFANEKDGLQGLPILRVLVTHMHPDHIGLAHWLCERFNAPLWISATDYYVARLASSNGAGFGGDISARYFASHGLVSVEAQEQIKKRNTYFPKLVPSVPLSFRRLMDGLIVRIGKHNWRCISGYGHAPEHISLYCDDLKLILGGDMLLPRISTNVSVYETEPEANPLPLFLDSLDRFLTLPESTFCLPSHGLPFIGIHTRVKQLHDHHQERFNEVLQACNEKACHAMEILPIMFKRELDLHQTTFALGEVVAHLNALWHEGKLERHLHEDGIYRFKTVIGFEI